jgi:hypothetical protein
MKSMASSIQPNLAASRTRHCSGEIVRYHGPVMDALVTAGWIMGRVSVGENISFSPRVGLPSGGPQTKET